MQAVIRAWFGWGPRWTGVMLAMVVTAALAHAGEPGEQLEPFALEEFQLSARVGADWTVVVDESGRGHHKVGFSLPPVWSEIDRQDVANVISIEAYRRPSIASLDDLVEHERTRISRILENEHEVTYDGGRAFDFETLIQGYAYKTRAVFLYADGVGVIVAFTATDATFPVNLPVFLRFLETVQLGQPGESG